MMRIYFLTLLLIGACSGPGAEEPELPEHIRDLENLTVYPYRPGEVPEIELIREMTFGSTDEHLIGAIDWGSNPMDPERVFKKVATDDLGRVYIGDVQQNTVHVYHPDGTWLTDLGRQGNGPGEVQYIAELDIISNRLYLIDDSQQEVEVFDLETFEPSHSLSLIPANQNEIEEISGLFPNYYYIRSDETVMTGFKKIRFQLIEDPENPGPLLFYAMDREGNIRPQKILEQQPLPVFFNGPSYFSFSFIPTSIRALSNDDHIYAAWTEDFLIKVYSPDGEYLRAFYYPFEKREIVRSELNRRGRLEGEVIASMDLPDPSFHVCG